MIIETQNLTKIYRTDVVETTAVDGINFTLSEGEFVSIMGPSGCGKSTLLHILGLIDSPSDGTYRFLGEDVAGYSESKRARLRKANIGFVFQSFNLIDELTVLRERRAAAGVQQGSPAERKRRVEAVLDPHGYGPSHRNISRCSSPAASSSAWPWPAPSSINPGSSSPTNRPATSTRNTATRS